jgi:C-terminal processing protease CtpA/Prc
MMGGKMMIWFSDRLGLRSHGSWGANDDVFGMFFTQEAWDRFQLTKAEFELVTEREKKEKEKKEKDEAEKKKSTPASSAKKKKKAPEQAPAEAPAEKEPDAEKEQPEKKKPEPVKIDLDDLEERTARLTIHSSDLADAVLTPDGEKLLYLARFEKGHDLWLHKPREKETKVLAKLGAEGGRLELDKDAKNVFVLAGGKVTKVEIESGKQTALGFSAEMDLNLPAERAYLFEHAWRQVLKKFYVADLHGVDWTFYKAAYARFLPHIDNNWDFAELLSEMLGELNASHTGAGYRPQRRSTDSTASLGIFADPSHEGPGLKIAEVVEKGPLQKAGTQIKPGVVIEKIDGQPITGDADPHALLNRKTDKPTLLSLFDPEAGKRWEETVKPISRDQEAELLYQRWVKSRREETERLSGGKVGYVHVRSMGDGSFRVAYAEILGRNSDKRALVVDTRFNGGGWLHDDLATLLSGRSYFTFIPRGNVIGRDPQEKWLKKSIVLMSESNYSNAHMFPLVYKKLGLGELVGMPVPGTGTAVWWETQQDRTLYFGIPQVGVLDEEGHYLENQELQPDHLVNNDPESVASGRDLQLEKAVELLLQGIASEK